MTIQNNYEIISDPFIIHKEKFWETDTILFKQLCNMISKENHAFILDMWCWDWGMTKKVYNEISTIKNIIGVDISEKMINKANKNTIKWIQYKTIPNSSEIKDNIVKNNTIDLAFSTYVLMEPDNEADVELILKNVYNKLKDNSVYFSLNSNIWEFEWKECYSYKIDNLPKNVKENEITTTYLRVWNLNKISDRLKIHDYYRSINKYIELFNKVWFKDVAITRLFVPIDSYIWIVDEEKHAPAYIISWRK